jgi:glycerate dehydrogenase
VHRIVFLDRATFPPALRAAAFEHEWVDFAGTSPPEVVERLRDASVAITNKVRLERGQIERLPALRMIAVCATGTDTVDLDACRERGILVSNIRGYARHAVPEHVFALILALRRNLLAYREDLRRGLWQRAEHFCLFTHPNRDLHGGRLGIVGRGDLGKAVATLGEAFGMRVRFAEHKNACAVRPGYERFEEVLETSDVLTLHCPLTPETRGMIGAPELRRMPSHALLINTARGGLVDETALAAALVEGVIAGAGFDVLSREPPRDGNPLLNLDLPNFILTPHVAWGSDTAMKAMADQLVDNIEAFVAGTPRNRVA